MQSGISAARTFAIYRVLPLCCVLMPSTFVSSARSAEWSIPLAGNCFRSAPSPSSNGFQRDGSIAWADADGVFSIYFHIDRGAALDFAINARVREGHSKIIVRATGQDFSISLENAEFAQHKIGRIEPADAGYVRVDVKGSERTGETYAEIRELTVASQTDGLELSFVKTNQDNMFYWGRRGPSVHLSYEMPKNQRLQYAYSEITVPSGQDAIGSFYMANGFGEGYFGIQVNGPHERRVLFSVWSPFRTDNPRSIPEDQRVVHVGSGPQVHVGEFGSEGSGGQSYLVYPWKADVTYCFLTEVKPDGPAGSTTYTAWFGEKTTDSWRLIASFRRPKTDTYLRGFHSFLESFDPTRGHIGRSALYGNVWVRGVDGQWSECTKARFSVDATGRNGHRRDFAGGADGERFFLRNCGFFNDTGAPDEVYSRVSTDDAQPKIDFDKLPRP
jgi:hypothetical protein